MKVERITDGNGNDVAGNPNHLANLNPLRYRSYFYDTETGFYWLNTRYYNPVVCRFLNADGQLNQQEGVTGYNLFQYCGNNPTNRLDPFGCSWIDSIKGLLTKAIEKIITSVEGLFIVDYAVPFYDQGDTNLCWAYCQTMVEDFYNDIVRSPIEAFNRAKEIAIGRHGIDNWNQGGRPDMLVVLPDINSINYLYKYLKRHGPLYASYGKYIDGQRKMGHAIVVTGVNLITGTVYTNNSLGTKGSQSFEEFLNSYTNPKTSGWKLDACFFFDFDWRYRK